MKRRSGILVLVVILVAVVACTEEAAMDGLAKGSMPAAPEMHRARQALRYAEAEPPPAAPAADARPDYWEQQKLIRTAQIGLEVGRVEAAIGRIEELVEARGGMLADSDRRRGDETWESANLTLRVPSEALDGLLTDLRKVGKVRHEGISTEDVTKAYFDLETRLSVKRQTEQRLRELLATPGAKLADLVAVERELDRVVTEIERMLGEKRYYDERIAISTVHVSLEERGAFVRPGAFTPVVQALRESAHVLGRSIGGLISFAILALPWVVVAFVVWRLFRWLRRRRSSKA